jgi:SM-20-related protein
VATTRIDPARPGPDWPAEGWDAELVAALGRGEALVFDGVLGPATSAAVAHALTASDAALTPAAIGRLDGKVVAPDLRGDVTRWLERADAGPLAPLWALFDRVGRELRGKAWLGTREMEVQLALYPGDGARYRRHRDAFAGGGRRRATAVYYLNPAWRPGAGGELRVFAPGGEAGGERVRELAPLLDRLVVFLAERVEHAVLPCSAPRWAATAWYLGPPAP